MPLKGIPVHDLTGPEVVLVGDFLAVGVVVAQIIIIETQVSGMFDFAKDAVGSRTEAAEPCVEGKVHAAQGMAGMVQIPHGHQGLAMIVLGLEGGTGPDHKVVGEGLDIADFILEPCGVILVDLVDPL